MMGLMDIGEEELSVVHLPDPIVLELNHLQNQLKEKDRELGIAHGEMKALKATEVLKDKAVEELTKEVKKLDEKLRVFDNVLEEKDLEIKKLTNEKKDAVAAQFAAEAALRRVYENQKADDFLPIESVLAPLEADIRKYKNENAALQEDKKALERLTKSKESALLEAERILRSALERALIVEEVQNQNFELKRQIEICQEENKILDKTNRQKVLEVEKLSRTIAELEETILAGGAAANAIRDYRRQISELNEEKRTLERELARIKVSANRVATVVANEWKDESDKVMPIKQWLEERRLFQAEVQRLKDKLAVSDRTAKAEAQLKDKFKLRLKTLEEGLKHGSSISVNANTFTESPTPEKPNHFLGCLSPTPEKPNHFLGCLSSNGGVKKRSTSQPRASTLSKTFPLQQANVAENENANADEEPKRGSSLKKKNGSGEYMLRKGLWASHSKVVDSAEKENREMKTITDINVDKRNIKANIERNEESNNKGSAMESEDTISGYLYDRLQREVINLRKACEMKDSTLNAKDEEIKMLIKKVDGLMKAIEVESKKVKKEAAAREKELISTTVDDKKMHKNTNFSKRATKAV